jgi:hypothetical protein
MFSPFESVNEETSNVRRKFLEGEPHQSNFPGPFPGTDRRQNSEYIQSQNSEMRNYNPTMVNRQMQSTYNNKEDVCTNYSQNNQMNMFPQFDGTKIERGRDPNKETFKDSSMTDPESQTGFGSIVPKFIEMPGQVSTSAYKCSSEDNPLLDMANRPISQFTHNNMVPNYGSKLTQNMYSTGVPQAGDNNECEGVITGFDDTTPYRGKLETFTGTDEMWMHKRETGPMFSPAEQQTGWVFGTPGIRPDLDRYKGDVWKRSNESPVEKVSVGPGIGIDYTVPAQGGFQQFTRLMPNNVNDYKANQLEGRVNSGAWGISHPTSQYIHGANQNTPDLTITQARRPTMATGFYTSAPSAGVAGVTDYLQSVSRGKMSRPDTEEGEGFGVLSIRNQDNGPLTGKESFANNGQEGVMNNLGACISYSEAPLGKIMGSRVPMPSQDLQSYSNIRETFKRGSAGYNESKGGYWECLDQEQGTNRWDLLGTAQGVVTAGETREGKYLNLTNRGEVNPFVINVNGLSTSNGVWSPNSYQDNQKVTRKETTQFSNAGNISGTTKATPVTWEDNQKVTRKETTQFSNAGNISGTTKATPVTWEDNQKVTRKETTEYAFAGNASKGGIASMSRGMFDGGDFYAK